LASKKKINSVYQFGTRYLLLLRIPQKRYT
jgi:hypothetical protein